jgi:hypothetical protein
MKKDINKNLLLIILIVGIVTMTIAYAVLSQQLDIKSSAVVQNKATSWDVHFKNVSCTASNYAEVTHPLEPASANTTLLSGLVATFKAPGDSVTCTFYVENSGEINAAITEYQKQDPTKTITYTGSGDNKTADEQLVTNKILYSLVYATDNSELQVGDQLNASQSKQLKLTLTLDSNLTSLPTNDVTISNFSTYIIYGQR